MSYDNYLSDYTSFLNSQEEEPEPDIFEEADREWDENKYKSLIEPEDDQ